MESELVRDSLLHLAGAIDWRLGGPSVKPQGRGEAAGRRSLYFTHSRDDQHAFLVMFDHADILRCYRRSESIVPQQALTLANSRMSLEAARKIAGRIDALDESGNLLVSGRSKDLIIRGGHNIHPSHIEALALRHPGLDKVAAVPVPL